LIGLGLGLSVVMGTFGGLYPAWKASRLVPMDAIRLGSH
jgi:putative ABC transport system permease protein